MWNLYKKAIFKAFQMEKIYDMSKEKVNQVKITSINIQTQKVYGRKCSHTVILRSILSNIHIVMKWK